MKEQFVRTEAVLGENSINTLSRCRVAVFGVGGVGGYVAEALARSGIGAIDLIDNDKVNESNINRQIIALKSTVGIYKTEAMKTRIADINPDCRVTAHNIFYLPENADTISFKEYDYVVDAIDTVSAKIDIIEKCTAQKVPVISSMGTGNKLNPTELEVTDIYKTSVCPLARVMRHELKKRNVPALKVVYSKEEPVKPNIADNERSVPGSVAFVPSVAGLIIAGEVIKDILEKRNEG